MSRLSSVVYLTLIFSVAACATRPPALPQTVTLTAWALDPDDAGCDFDDPMDRSFGFVTEADTVPDQRARRHVYGGLVRMGIARPPGRICLALIRWEGGEDEKIQALYGFEGRPLDRDRLSFRRTRMFLARSTADPRARAARVAVTLGVGDSAIRNTGEPAGAVLTIGEALNGSEDAPVILNWPFGVAPGVLAVAVTETRARGRLDATGDAQRRRELIARMEVPPLAGS